MHLYCYFKHNWLYIDGFDRRLCLRCKRYQHKAGSWWEND